MAHTWSNGLNGLWYDGYLATGADLSSLDGLIASLINGDGGGTWVPTSAITIGGQGINVLAPWSLSTGAVASESSAKPWTFGDDDYFVIAAGNTFATRTIETQCSAGLPSAVAATFAGEVPISWVITNDITTGTFIGTSRNSGSAQPVPMVLAVPIRVHNGAVIASVSLTFAIGQSHAGVPENLPKWRVVAISRTGQITPLNSTYTGGYDAQGYLLLAPPASASAYYNGGAPRTQTYACDAGVVIDTSMFEYAVEIVDEWGVSGLVGNLYLNASAAFTTITSMSPQT